MQVQVVDIRKRVLGEEHPDSLMSMANLASTYQNQSMQKEAETLEELVEIRNQMLGEEHSNSLVDMVKRG